MVNWPWLNLTMVSCSWSILTDRSDHGQNFKFNISWYANRYKPYRPWGIRKSLSQKSRIFSLWRKTGKILKSKKKLSLKDGFFSLWNFDLIKNALGSWARRIDSRVSGPRFSDSSWSIWFIAIRKSRNNHFEILTLLRFLGPGALTMDSWVSGPRFSDSRWSNWP